MDKADFMKAAFVQAKKAYKKDETPIGAVIVKDGKIIARAYNKRETWRDATAHCEIIAIRKACKKLKSWRLIDCDLYVTLEPCPMCAGAILQSRIRNLYYGASDPKAGCCGSVVDLLKMDGFNHTVYVERGIMEEECGRILTDFFKNLRMRKIGKFK